MILLPDDVSFLNLYFKEEEIGATTSGWLSFLNGQGHSPGPSARIGFGTINQGARVAVPGDQIFSGSYSDSNHGPYANGTANWAIPWDYSITGNVGSWHLITTVNMTASSTSTGRCTISKDGSGSFSKELNDPTSNW